MQKLKSEGREPDLPRCEALEIVGYLMDAGPTLQTAAGESPLTHSELRAWQDNTSTVLQPWQASLIKRLSEEYLSQRIQSVDPHAPAPYMAEPSEATRASVSKRLKEGLRSLMNTRPKR